MRACAACEMKMACGADRGQHGEDTSPLHPHTHTIFISSHFQSSEPIEASDFQFQTYLIYFIYTHTTHTSVDFRGYARRISNHGFQITTRPTEGTTEEEAEEDYRITPRDWVLLHLLSIYGLCLRFCELCDRPRTWRNLRQDDIFTSNKRRP